MPSTEAQDISYLSLCALCATMRYDATGRLSAGQAEGSDVPKGMPATGCTGRNGGRHRVLAAWLLGAAHIAGPALGAGPGPAPVPGLHGRADVAAQVRSFNWREFDSDGRRIVKESGPLYGLRLAAEGYWSAVGGRFVFETVAGSPDYDGQTQDGAQAQSHSDYAGFDCFPALALRTEIATTLDVRGFAGPALRGWRRTLESTAEARGYTETWWILDARAGAGLHWRLPGGVALFAEGGFKIPLRTAQEADLGDWGFGTLTLHPEQTASPFAEAGIAWRFLVLSGFYDSLRFDPSSVVRRTAVVDGRSAPVGFWQPESRADAWGATLGLRGAF